jgi:hypothetical protein
VPDLADHFLDGGLGLFDERPRLSLAGAFAIRPFAIRSTIRSTIRCAIRSTIGLAILATIRVSVRAAVATALGIPVGGTLRGTFGGTVRPAIAIGTSAPFISPAAPAAPAAGIARVSGIPWIAGGAWVRGTGLGIPFGIGFIGTFGSGEVGVPVGLIPAGVGEVGRVVVFGVFGEAGGDILGASDLGLVASGVEHPVISRACADGLGAGGRGGTGGLAGAESAGGAEAGGAAILAKGLMAHGKGL